jgi:hypothetical protein
MKGEQNVPRQETLRFEAERAADRKIFRALCTCGDAQCLFRTGENVCAHPLKFLRASSDYFFQF